MSDDSESSSRPASSHTASPARPNTDATMQTLFASDPTMLSTKTK